MLKLKLLKFELLGETQRLPVKLFLLTKQKLLLLTLSLLTLPFCPPVLFWPSPIGLNL